MFRITQMELPTFLTIEAESGDTVVLVRQELFEKNGEGTAALRTETGESRKEDLQILREDMGIRFERSQDGLKIYLLADYSRVKHLKLRWNVPAPKGARVLGDAWERSYGELEWRGISGGRLMPWYFFVKTKTRIAGYGVKVRPNAMCFWQMDSRGITLVLDIRCGGCGVELRGRELEVVTLVSAEAGLSADIGQGTGLEQGADSAGHSGSEKDKRPASLAFAKDFCRMMCSDPILPDHPVYGANNWYYAYGNSSEEEILQDTDSLTELTKDLENPPYMVIDDCWQKLRKPEYIGGPWNMGNEKFPDMKALAEKIKAKGARPGIWIRFLLNQDDTIREEWRLSHNGCLDPTHPEALDFIREDVRRICEWGYQLIKHDFSTYDLFGKWGFEMNPYVTPDGWHFYDRSKTGAEVVKMLYEAILDVAREYGVIILGCNTIGHLGAGLMHMNRTGDDTSGKNWERTRIMGVNTLAFRLPQHRSFFDVDADCVGITGRIPWSLNREFADAVARSGTSLFVSMKPGVLTEQEKDELKVIFEIASRAENHFEPMDWEENNCPDIWTDGENTVEYNWYRENGGVSECQPRKYYVTIPIS